jgi:hypothetical protein
MFEYFAAYLDLIVSPERKRVYLDACNALVSVGMVEHGLQIDQQISLAENGDTEIFLHSIDTLLGGVLMQTIGEFGVQVDHEATLSQLTDILTGLTLIENYDDHETIYSLCQAPEGVEAALADILELMGAFPSHVYLSLLTAVRPELLDRIEGIHSEEALQPEADPAQVDRARSRVTQFLAKRTVPSAVSIYLSEGGRLGVPLDELVKPWRDRLDTLTMELAGIELVGLAYASDLEDVAMSAALSHEAELLFSDMTQITQLTLAINKALKDFPYA